jgi:uncharacterized protein YceH (UPF0502 family)
VGDSRVTKFEHRLQDAFNFYRPEIAVLCELLLRGPQTPGELRTRASRMHAFEDLESVHSALHKLEKREPPMAAVLPRQPGTKEARYAHLLGEATPVAADASAFVNAAREQEKQPATARVSSSERVEALVQEVAQLRSQFADLQQQFAAFRKQFE